jgi:nitrite transporter NirC
MTYAKTVDDFAALAVVKARASRADPVGFLIASLMAGAYVGIGIILIFSVGQTVDPGYRSLVMGASFGIALTLVIFAGSELFTGHTMYMTLGVLRRTIGLGDLGRCWAMTWVGNLIGSALLAALFVAGGGGAILKEGADLVFTVSAHKMHSTPVELVARAILCNWLVCLAIWTSARTTNDAAKCILIFWCLFAFIASGFEHSVANMTLFAVALLGPHPEEVTFGGMVYNLFWVSIGNAISGAVFVAAGYWGASSFPEKKIPAPPVDATPEAIKSTDNA